MVWYVLLWGEAKGFVPFWIVKVDGLILRSIDGLEPVVKDDVVLVRDLPGVEVEDLGNRVVGSFSISNVDVAL